MGDNVKQLTDWLPTTKKEMTLRGWEEVDVILFSGDAYVDHPSFGTAVIGRLLESEGLRVAIVPQPNWRDDLRDFKKLGKPRLFFAITAGVMDSMINRYTANKRIRSNDAYTPDGRSDMRPDRAVTVYSRILKELYPEVPILLGGVEASLRRVTHYDYWDDALHKTILAETGAEMLIYGMGEQPLRELVSKIKSGATLQEIEGVPQTAFLRPLSAIPANPFPEEITLFSHEECLQNKQKQARNFRMVEEQSNRLHAARILQQVGEEVLIVNPPFPPMREDEIDASFDLPYTRLPHPKYRNKVIPAYEMIKFSVNLHRGCFGGCAFCTISAHQGKFIASRSKESILEEVKKITQMPDFKGYISDLGGPSANMYRMQGKDLSLCEKCKRPSCIFPKVCINLNANHKPLIDIYRAVDALPGVKKSFVSSGIRYDMLVDEQHSDKESSQEYIKEVVTRHVSGRLKVAPEHTSDSTLNLMRKPSFKLFHQFKKIFDKLNNQEGLKQQLIPYFISSHPGCTEEDMADLAAITKDLDFRLEQVQDFTPSPMTLATEIYYTGYHPYTLKPVYTATTKEEKNAQRQFFFWHDRQNKQQIIRALKKMNRPDLIKKLYPKG